MRGKGNYNTSSVALGRKMWTRIPWSLQLIRETAAFHTGDYVQKMTLTACQFLFLSISSQTLAHAVYLSRTTLEIMLHISMEKMEK